MKRPSKRVIVWISLGLIVAAGALVVAAVFVAGEPEKPDYSYDEELMRESVGNLYVYVLTDQDGTEFDRRYLYHKSETVFLWLSDTTAGLDDPDSVPHGYGVRLLVDRNEFMSEYGTWGDGEYENLLSEYRLPGTVVDGWAEREIQDDGTLRSVNEYRTVNERGEVETTYHNNEYRFPSYLINEHYFPLFIAMRHIDRGQKEFKTILRDGTDISATVSYEGRDTIDGTPVDHYSVVGKGILARVFGVRFDFWLKRDVASRYLVRFETPFTMYMAPDADTYSMDLREVRTISDEEWEQLLEERRESAVERLGLE